MAGSEHERAWGRAAPWLAGVGTMLFAAAIVIEVFGLFGVPRGTEDGPFFTTLLGLAVLSWGGAGTLIGTRRPHNAIGLVLAGEAFLLGLISCSETFGQSHLPLRSVTEWIFGDALLVPLLLAVPLLLLLFPTGRPPSRRWRWTGWALAASAATGIAGFTVRGPEPTEPAFLAELLLSASGILGLIATVLAFVSVVVRFRRSRGEERAQMRWLVFIALLGAMVFVVNLVVEGVVGEDSTAAEILFGILLVILTVGLPASIGISILRYRLYELDVVIKKTVVFGVVAATITFVAVLLLLALPVGLFGTGLSGWERGLLLVGVALGLLVGPLRRRAGRLANRIVYGNRATPYEVLTAFSERVGGTYATEDVLPRMARLLVEGTGASQARVLVRVGPELVEGGRWPDDEPPGSDPHVEPVLDGGEELGALAVSMPQSDPMNPTKEALIRDLASQAGLLLRNVKLIEELRASRQRLVAAQDQERRKIERNLHDGAQQQLVALTVQLKLARGLVERDPQRAGVMLDTIQGSATGALEDLRDLARGIYPPLLADQGLSAALEAQARKAALPITVEAESVGRYPQEVESAVYFCTLEALNNAAKYAEANHATVKLSQQNGQLAFSVEDDGRGFDPNATEQGTGLQGMVDRLEAIGGVLTIDSEPGGGTSVRGLIPTGARP